MKRCRGFYPVCELRCHGDVVARAATEHAMIDDDGRVRRIPRERRENLRRLLDGA